MCLHMPPKLVLVLEYSNMVLRNEMVISKAEEALKAMTMHGVDVIGL